MHARRLLLVIPLAFAGCYDSELMLERVRNQAIRTRLEEVPLGDYRVTLPRDPRTGEMTEVVVSVFGTTVHYRADQLSQRVRDEEALLRHNMLMAIREACDEELAQPGLEEFRARLLEAANSALGDTPIESIGFYSLRLIRN